MDDDSNLNSLFENLNMISANEITQRRVGGGTGGGAQMFQGNMDPNPLIGLNPYLSENVTSFDNGGSVNYSVDPYEKPEFSMGYDGGLEENRINKIRQREFRAQSGLNPYPVQIHGGPSQDPYRMAYAAEEKKRAGQRWLDRLVSGNLHGIDHNQQDLKNPWEQGYDNWYGQANKGMKMPKYNQYDNGGKNKKAYYKHGGKAQYSDLHDLPQQEYDRAVQGGMNRYNVGGSYLQQANQSIQASQQADEQQALGQISGLLAKKLQGQMSTEQATNIASQMAESSGLVNQPMANKGMKMPKYDQGGATHTMPDGTVHPGATHEDYMAMMSGANSLYMANKGMRMKKRYTQGGRF